MKMRLSINDDRGERGFESEAEVVKIARDRDADLLLHDDLVSNPHAQITVSESGAFLTDLGSKNGTFKNGAKVVERTSLRTGDRLRFGNEGPEILVRLEPSTAPVPAPAARAPALNSTPSPAAAPIGVLEVRAKRYEPPAPAQPEPSPTRMIARRTHSQLWMVAAVTFVLLAAIGGSLAAYWLTARTDSDQLQAYDKVLGSCVFVAVLQEDDEGNWVVASTGSGSLIDAERRLVVTNNHVIADEENQKAQRVVVFFPQRNADGELITDRAGYLTEEGYARDFRIEAEIVKRARDKDLAVLRLAKVPKNTPPLPLAESTISTGEDVYKIGCPAWRMSEMREALVPRIGPDGKPVLDAQGRPVTIRTRYPVSANQQNLWALTKGTVRNVYRSPIESMKNTMTVESTIPANPGDSGGPIVDRYGRLVAVLWGGITGDRASLITMSTDVSEVKEFLANIPR